MPLLNLPVDVWFAIMEHTFAVDIDEAFTDVTQSPTCLIRTVSRHVPLDQVVWVEVGMVEGNWEHTDLPKEW